MDRKNLTDYYPVYKDIADLMQNKTSESNFDYPVCKNDLSSESEIPGLDPGGSQDLIKGEMLLDMALKHDLPTLQTILLILKNSFEGHVFLKYNIRPEQIFSQGTILLQNKPEIMILNFYENIVRYEPGLNKTWSILQERDPDLAGINFEILVHYIIVHHLIRFPVSLFSSSGLRIYTDEMLMNRQAMQQRLTLVLLGERYAGEFEFIEMVNNIYAVKYKDYMNKLRIKEDVLTHYQKKLVLALSTDIKTENELDDLMYSKLLEEKTSRISKNSFGINPDGNGSSETLIGRLKIREKTKVLYRSVSKNCCEVHSDTESEDSFPELTKIFLTANSTYIQPAANLAEALLQYMRMVTLLSKVVIFRKTHGLAITGDPQVLSNVGFTEAPSKDDLKSLKKEIDTVLVEYRLKYYTDNKMKFIMDDELTDIHNNFLQKQMDYIDQQIAQIQSDITEILKMKSNSSILKTSKNREN